MKSGVRFFDIRGRASADNMISVHHGMVYLHHELGKFLDDAKYYLSAYRTNCDVYEKGLR